MRISTTWLRRVRALLLLYLLIVLAAVIALALFEFESGWPDGDQFVGCYQLGDIVPYYVCEGFFGSSVVAAWLSIPYIYLVLNMAFFYSIEEPAHYWDISALFIVVIVLWSPVFLVIYVSIQLRLRRRATADGGR